MPSFTRRHLLHIGLAATALTASASSFSQTTANFPSKPIKFIVPFGPGSGTDTSARYYAKKLQEVTGQPVVVENRPGGNGFIAVKQALGAPADGYTVFIGSNSTLAVNAALFKALPYDPQKDFAPLTMLMRAPAVLVAPGDSDVKTLKDLVAKAQANPGKVNFGAGSAGYQLMGELLNDVAKVHTVHVPFPVLRLTPGWAPWSAAKPRQPSPPNWQTGSPTSPISQKPSSSTPTWAPQP